MLQAPVASHRLVPQETAQVPSFTRGNWAALGLITCGSPIVGSGLMCQSVLPPCLGALQSFSAPRLALGSAKWESGIKDCVGFNACNHIYGNLNKSKENCSYFSFFLFLSFFFFSGLFWSCRSTP